MYSFFYLVIYVISAIINETAFDACDAEGL